MKFITITAAPIHDSNAVDEDDLPPKTKTEYAPLTGEAKIAHDKHALYCHSLLPQHKEAFEQHEKWCTELQRLQNLFDEENVRWGEEMKKLLPGADKFTGFEVTEDGKQYCLTNRGEVAEAAQPDWAKELMKKFEDEEESKG